MRTFAIGPEFQNVGTIWSSSETKAIEPAGILAARIAIGISVEAGLGESDRSSTGFLERDEFERTADTFFLSPGSSVRGWDVPSTHSLE